MATGRIKKALTLIPETIASAATFIRGVADAQRKINALRRDAKARVREINRVLDEAVKPLIVERDTFFNNLFAFAGPKKVELTKEKRSVKTDAGTFGWRWTPPYVELSDGITDEVAILKLEASGLGAYVRVVKEIDRAALLQDRPNVNFLTYVQREEFFAKPKLLRTDGSAEELTTEVVDLAK